MSYHLDDLNIFDEIDVYSKITYKDVLNELEMLRKANYSFVGILKND